MKVLASLQERISLINFWEPSKLFDLKIVTLELINYLMSEYVINRKDQFGGIREVISHLQTIYQELHELRNHKNELHETRFIIYRDQIRSCIESAIAEVQSTSVDLQEDSKSIKV